MLTTTTALISALLALAGASAGPAATVDQGGGSRIDLYADAGPCVGDARRAEYVPADGDRVTGCWVTTSQGVFVVFLDGDIARVPSASIKKPTST